VLLMEFVEGGSLADRLRRGPLDDAEFARLARGLLLALEAVHAAGTVHRDVKPSNVLLTREGEAKLSDFGIARLPGLETTVGPSGAVVGTVRYMSPEQARGHRVTQRSDLFSAAATLFEARSGKPYLEPKPGESAAELQVRAGYAKPFRQAVAGRPAVRAWFAKALHPDPAERFASAAQMRGALEEALAKPPGRLAR
jgi:serine/threonine-protein kinase